MNSGLLADLKKLTANNYPDKRDQFVLALAIQLLEESRWDKIMEEALRDWAANGKTEPTGSPESL